jgi:phosphoribosylanthranilate isomerase
MWVKICANTNLADAMLAAELGADALGFVFATSRRQVTPAQAAAITPHLPAKTEKVGVFLTQSAEEIAQIVDEAHLDTAQLHGDYDAALISRLCELLSPGFGVIQTIHWRADAATPAQSAASAAELTRQLAEIRSSGLIDRVLIDSKVGSESGGTGVSFDWKAARDVLHQQGAVRTIAAGGLNPDNIAHAIETMRPWGVDVATGVESSPGQKEPDKLARFIQIARSF